MNVNDLLKGSGGAPSLLLHDTGDSGGGTITDMTTGQAREFGTGEPKTWPDGNPQMQIILTLQTDQRDPEIEDDNGLRRLFIDVPSDLSAAVAAALNEHGKDTELEIGGKLGVEVTGKGKSKIGTPKKLHRAQYKKPAPQTVSGADLV